MGKKKDALSFNFGANKVKKPPRTTKNIGGNKTKSGAGAGNRSNAWRSYVGVSNAPIPD